MNTPRATPPQRVPTLTEVVEPLFRPAPMEPHVEPHVEPLTEPGFDAPVEYTVAPDPHASMARGGAEVHGIDENQLIERVLSDLQRQVELMLEYRLREVLTPALTRATEALMRDARVELASTLRDVVARAVAQELSRHRGR
jgi:hypothetical protein